MDAKITELVEYLKGTVEGKCAIALAGAHAKGAADASSDIDIYVFAERAKPFEERKALLSAIAESGLDARAMPAVFLGGGAALLKRHVSATDGLCRPFILDDVCMNAKGYERLVGQMSRGVADGG